MRRVLLLLMIAAMAACSDNTNDGSPAAPDTGPGDVAADPTEDAGDMGDTEDTENPDAGDVRDVQDEPDVDEPDVPPDVEPDVADVEPDPCETFAVAQAHVVIPPLRSHEIVATGGGGVYSYRFAPDGNRSGAILGEGSGLYLSGRTGGGTDDVLVVDVACERELLVEIEVVAAMLLLPVEAEVAPGDSFCFALAGGSGQQDDPDGPFVWRRSQRGSGPDGTVDAAGCYDAGTVEGVDIIEVEDAATGETREARVQVTRGPIELRTDIPRLMLPSGETFPLRVRGGSGAYDFAVRGEADVVLEPDEDEPWAAVRVTAFVLPGSAEIEVTDRFSPERTLTLEVEVLARLSHDHVAYGTHSDGTTVVALGDIDGDGHGDVAIGARSASLNGQHSGAVYVYRGGQETEAGMGLGPEPAQILFGSQRYDYFGRAIAVGDYDNDGCPDLAVPAWGRSAPGGQTGVVEIWSGCNTQPGVDAYRGDYFGRAKDNLPGAPEVPALVRRQTLVGPTSGDRFGFSVASGDFNGDGRTDLAVGSPYDESPELVDPDTNAVLANNGRVRIYLGEGSGLSEAPWLVIDGLILEEDGTLRGARDLEFGQRMDAGDVNDDGCDDLLVGAPRYDNYRGAASLLMSSPSDEFESGCALTGTPAVFVVNAVEDERRSGRLGWEVELADLDGDCVEDIISTQFTAAVPGRGSTNAGNIFFVSGRDSWAAAEPRRVRRDQARFVFFGDDWDNFGTDFSTGDIDGDGVRDLVVGSRWGEGPGTLSNVGEVKFYRGLAGPGCNGLDPEAAPFEEPVSLYNMDRYGDLFGQSLAVVPDVDGDEVADVVILASRGPAGDLDDLEDHLGRAYVFSGGSMAPEFEQGAVLSMPAVVAEEFFGYAVERVTDFNGDGFDDLLVSAPWFDRDEPRENDTLIHQSAGAAYLYYGGRDGIRAKPDLIFRDYENHSGGDLLGYGLATAGDFDGDGAHDVVVAALGEDSTGGPCVACRGGGPGRNSIGAAYVFLGGAVWGGPHSGAEEDTPRASDPDFIICGPPETNAQMGREVHGGFDHDGDGFDDLLLSNWNRSGNRGVVWVIPGRPRGEGTEVVCTTPEEHEVARGEGASDYVGWRMDAADINQDGCDDVLIGGYNVDDEGASAAGAIIVRLGSGPRGCPSEPVTFWLVGERANENMGYGLSVADVDGDGVPDLLVGSTGIGPSNEGAVTVIDGALLAGATSEVDAGISIPMDASLRQGYLRDPTGRAGVEFGRSIANLGDINGDGMDDVAVTSRTSRIAAFDDEGTGGAFVFHGATDTADLEVADIWIGGETTRAWSYFGERIAGGRLGPGAPAVLAIGAAYSDSPGPGAGEVGAVFVGQLAPPLR
jgi:hypothetical protein